MIIGPGGVFTLNTKNHSRGKVWVAQNSFLVNGQKTDYLRNSRYEAKTTELVPGDVLVWYTDGIVECENDRGEEYGEKRFRAAIRKAAEHDPVEMRQNVVLAAGQFFGDRPRKDDITLVLGRVA